MNLSTSVSEIPRIGPVYQRKLKRLGIKTVRDLLFHFPHRYEDFSNIKDISSLKINEDCCIKGTIKEISNARTWKKRMILTKAIVQDQTGAAEIIWFNQPYLAKTIKKGDLLALAGRMTLGKKSVYISNPAYEKLGLAGSGQDTMTHMGRIVPVYPETEGLSSRWLRFIIKPALINLKNSISDPLPKRLIEKEKLLTLSESLWQAHFPDSLELAKKAKERFSFEELFNIAVLTLRMRFRIAGHKAPAIPLNLGLIQEFVGSLSYKLTDAQRKSAWNILKDMEKPRPMNRLLEGDVGSGKTVVAAMAAINAIKAGYQTAIMAPTEILAKQHFKTFSELFSDFKTDMGLLTGKEDKLISKKLKNDVVEISRERLLEKAKSGELPLLIGTHTLIQSKVKFGKLALVILDEQHRFGVEQRARLCQGYGGQTKLLPHLLSMTATPIPRTLALTLYGDLDLSLIDSLPKGRKKIMTKVVEPKKRNDAYRFIKEKVNEGRQVFVICPRIEPAKTPEENLGGQDSKKDVFGWAEAKSVKDEHEKLSKKIFPDLKIDMLHGKMKPKEKEKIMRNFKNKKIDILVSTSVIEVGIDIPNAAVMIIEGAERFGLAQLHQLRGRVGRSKYQSYCFLFTDSKNKKTIQRLQALIKSENSFELAEKDLKIRGPGDFTGARQWGIPDLIMDSLTNMPLVQKTKEVAKEILEKDPGLKNYPSLLKRVEELEKIVHLE
ncbi:MAG: ATP-dependent DNA helicase RecG [Candidatus Nealsonbacteria bacterium]|nr:ATP-dependent DNA helicase RecG [Candidatus Nealsonbacteria bacterium]